MTFQRREGHGFAKQLSEAGRYDAVLPVSDRAETWHFAALFAKPLRTWLSRLRKRVKANGRGEPGGGLGLDGLKGHFVQKDVAVRRRYCDLVVRLTAKAQTPALRVPDGNHGPGLLEVTHNRGDVVQDVHVVRLRFSPSVGCSRLMEQCSARVVARCATIVL